MPTESTQLLILADDLTGANDTAVQFADFGYKTLWINSGSALETSQVENGQVISMNTATRSHYDTARAELHDLIHEILARQANRQLYLKIDSTMRGSVREQIQGVLSALPTGTVALVCPAFPTMGRTVEDNTILVNGVKVTESRSGRDPITPVQSADLSDLIPDSSHIQPHWSDEHKVEFIKNSQSNIFTFDASSHDDLVGIAQLARKIDRQSVLVGSAGLAQGWIGAQGHTIKAPRPIPSSAMPPLVVVTSIHDVSQQQVDEYISSSDGCSTTVFSPQPAQLATDESLPTLVQQVKVLTSDSNGALILRANPTVIASKKERTALAADFAVKLAELAQSALDQRQFGSLIIFGGDGAESCFKRLGISSTQVISSIADGVPYSIANSGHYGGLPVITKSGGFGHPTLLTEIINMLWKGVPHV